MDIRDLISRYIIVELKDGETVKGILTNVLDEDDGEYFYTALQIRIKEDDYRLIYMIEVESLGEIV